MSLWSESTGRPAGGRRAGVTFAIGGVGGLRQHRRACRALDSQGRIDVI
jgi:hypothetical protein